MPSRIATIPRFGQADLSNCEREQIHLAASVQPHGALLLVREPDLVVIQASGNAASFLDLPDPVLGCPLGNFAGDLLKRIQPHLQRPLSEIPNGSVKPENLWILAWDPDEEKVVKLSLPFWMLRMGRKKMTVMESSGFDLERLNVDWRELERIGPALVFDLKSSRGERVLIWTR